MQSRDKSGCATMGAAPATNCGTPEISTAKPARAERAPRKARASSPRYNARRLAFYAASQRGIHGCREIVIEGTKPFGVARPDHEENHRSATTRLCGLPRYSRLRGREKPANGCVGSALVRESDKCALTSGQAGDALASTACLIILVRSDAQRPQHWMDDRPRIHIRPARHARDLRPGGVPVKDRKISGKAIWWS